MRLFAIRSSVLCSLLAVGVASDAAIARKVARSDTDGLQRLLSRHASISNDVSTVPRWSDFDAPRPGTIVNVATERDVQVTVQWCLKHKRPFMAQSGGHGWQDKFNLSANGVLINMRGLNSTTISRDKKTACVGGGTIVKEVIETAYANDVQVLTGNCNCVGTLGAALGGGYGNLLGMYGFSVDNILSMNVVTANGDLVTVTPKDRDLFWALRGAGPNFGIVTSAVYKAYPMPKAQNTAWLGGLFFSPDKIEQLVQAIDNLRLEPRAVVFLYFATSGPPSYQPAVLVTLFFFGSEAEGRAAFKSILDIGPFQDTTAVLPYNQWNAGADGFCIKGGRKPAYAAGFGHMVPSTWRKVWNEYLQWLQTPGTGNSAILVECYSLQHAQQYATDASFANRDVRFNAAVLPWYNDPSLDASAEAFAGRVRDLWRATDGLPANRTYVNFAHGDEDRQQLYGSSTARLQRLKKRYDSYDVFSHWFDLA